MTITATGAISFSDLRTEFVGGSSAISLGDLYRGGSNIRKLASDNTATNLAASVPTSGAIDMEDFYSTAKGFTKTYSSGANNQDAGTIFGDDFDVDYPKNIIINSGVELGATSTSEEALEVPAGGAGLITITNNGTLSGAGGAAGGAGGDAFETSTTCTFINNGTVRAGGGGGGAGGTGGGGQYSQSSQSGYNYLNIPGFTNYYWRRYPSQSTAIVWANSVVYSAYTNSTSVSGTGGTYQRGTAQENNENGTFYSVAKTTTTTTNTNGGAGGAGGVGQGFGQSAASGSGGSGGGTNAGTGGTGGTGGAYGAAGSTGSTGANGNRTNGSAGASGGAAGKYARQTSGTLTFTNNGTVQGNAP